MRLGDERCRHALSPLDVIFKRITVRGFLLNDFDFASLVRPVIE